MLFCSLPEYYIIRKVKARRIGEIVDDALLHKQRGSNNANMLLPLCCTENN